jgi:hypothetical protein
MENNLWLSCVLSTDEISNEVNIFVSTSFPETISTIFQNQTFTKYLDVLLCHSPLHYSNRIQQFDKATQLLVNEKTVYTGK